MATSCGVRGGSGAIGITGFSSPATRRYKRLASAFPGTMGRTFLSTLQHGLPSAQIQTGHLERLAMTLETFLFQDRRQRLCLKAELVEDAGRLRARRRVPEASTPRPTWFEVFCCDRVPCSMPFPGFGL